jgi:hypothetical protein
LASALPRGPPQAARRRDLRNRFTLTDCNLQLANFELEIVEFGFIDQFQNMQNIIFAEFHSLNLSLLL